MATAEVIRDMQSPAAEVAAQLTDQLLHHPEQLRLFEDRDKEWDVRNLARLRAENPAKFIVAAELVEDYRFEAAYRGAGFHPANFEELFYNHNDPDDVGRLVAGGLYGQRYRIPERSRKLGNRYGDEILHNTTFTQIVPTTKYDLSTSHYVTTPEDLQKLLEYDYENLQACRDLDFDLFYERED